MVAIKYKLRMRKARECKISFVMVLVLSVLLVIDAIGYTVYMNMQLVEKNNMIEDLKKGLAEYKANSTNMIMTLQYNLSFLIANYTNVSDTLSVFYDKYTNNKKELNECQGNYLLKVNEVDLCNTDNNNKKSDLVSCQRNYKNDLNMCQTDYSNKANELNACQSIYTKKTSELSECFYTSNMTKDMLIFKYRYPQHIPYNVQNSYYSFDKIYGGASDNYANSIIQSLDGGYVTAGCTLSKRNGQLDARIIKINSAGDLLWDKTYGGGASDDIFYSIIQSLDGGYVIAGYTSSKGNGNSDAWIIKINSAGDLQWDRTYGGASWDVAYSIIQSIDGGYAIVGYTSSKGNGNYYVWIIKINNAGDLIWDKTYGGALWDAAFSIVQSLDGGYAIAGEVYSKGNGQADAWIIKINSAGDLLWDKTYGGTHIDFSYSIIQSLDGGYAITGLTGSKGNGNFDAWIIKINSAGDLQWDKTFGGAGDDRSNSIIQSIDGGYAIAGYTSSKGNGNFDAWLIKINSAGDLIWDKTYGGAGDDRSNSIIQSIDGGYVIAGYTSSKGNGNYDTWIIKINNK